MKVLVDTCIVIDFLQKREPFSESAKELFIAAASNKIKCYVTAKSVTDIYYLIHRYTHNDKETRDQISKLLNIVSILDTSGNDIINAIPSEIKDFEDAVMCETGKREKADCIVTRNLSDFKNSAIKICSVEDLLQ